MTTDEERSAHLLFSEELGRGAVDLERVLATPEVHQAVRDPGLPSIVRRTHQRLQLRRGTASFREWSVEPMLRARRAVLGEQAAGPPRFLIRMDEFPHVGAWDRPESYGTPGFERFHAILRDAGLPYLLAVLPRVPRKPMDPHTAARPHDPSELAELELLLQDPDMAFGVHGLDHRTRSTTSRRHSEFAGLGPDALRWLLDAADAELAALGLPTNILVPPFNRFDARQYEEFARRYEIVTGGPESVRGLGFHRTPVVRSGAVYVPAYAPLYGRAREVLPAVEELVALQPGMWIPVVLHWGWEQDEGWTALERLADTLSGLARPWSELSSAARAGAAHVEALRAGGRT